MREPELLFAEDGSIVSWLAQDGLLLVGISDATESHEHRLVLGVEDVAPMLLAAMDSAPEPQHEWGTVARLLRLDLVTFMARLDALKADAR